jgi:hypothetical protein
MKSLGAFLVVALFVGAGIHANDVSTAQQRLAKGWSGDDARFSASGLSGQNLQIALPGESQVACDAMVDAIRSDSKLVGELRRANFRSVECGQAQGELR